MKPQNARILALLRNYGDHGVTQRDALRELGCYRLAARIAELKAEGYPIEARQALDTHGHRYARYFLIPEPVQQRLAI